MSKTAPYGTWDSPIDGDAIISKTIVFDDVIVDPATQKIYYLQESPSDGRCLIVDQYTDTSVLPSPYSARTLVQEYGGAPAIVHDSIIYFSYYTGNASDPNNSIYTINVQDEQQVVTRVTPVNKWWRYANFAIHPTQTNLLVTLREDHTYDPDGTHSDRVINTICVIDVSEPDNDPIIVIGGAGFYATPVFNPSGNKIGWQEWNLPYMPWEAGVVYVADIAVDSASLKLASEKALVNGDPNQGTSSATFPRWITDTTLVYITDAYNQFQNPYIYNTETKDSTAILEKEQDFAEPAWYLGYYPYAILGGGKYGAFTAFQDGRNILYIIDFTASSPPVQITPFDYTVAQHVRTVTEDIFVFTASQAAAPGGVIAGTVSPDMSSMTFQVLKASADPSPLTDYISTPEPKTLPASGGRSIYVVYYPPYNPDYSGSSITEKPPCILNVHGGPTGLEPQALNWTKMFYTSRGFGWLDVNYRGSSGYGRQYIELLNGHWGDYDNQDCKEAAAILASQGTIDGDRVAIRGGSAGAYTTLSSVTFALDPQSTYPKSACGAYGCVADVTTLIKVVEKFESKYIYTLLGGDPDTWGPRNPIDHADKMTRPLLTLQGLVDGVVPPEIVRNFIAQSVQVAPSQEFAFYPDEPHHWHLESTILDALARESRWYLTTLL